jgi:threonine/homoserine/homoserine lactone efflux protein
LRCRSVPEGSAVYLPDLATLISFTIAAFVVVIVPGITVSAVVSTALARGLRGGLWLELGATIARFTMVLVVAVALEAVTSLVTAIFEVIKYAGAAYLVWLGLGYLTSRHGVSLESPSTAETPARQVFSGFLVLWGNPKALLFFGAFLPLFVDRSHPIAPQVLVLGLIEMAAAIITDTGYIVLASSARHALGGAGTQWINRVAGVILIGAAIWLALQRH